MTREIRVTKMRKKQSRSKQTSPITDYVQFYHLESYLFDTVHQRFAHQGYLGAFDFFCIVIWKANRAKTRIARKLLGARTGKSLDDVVKELTKSIAAQETPEMRMRFLICGDFGFRLPMASAILTVLYPDDFTVYDYRVCEALNGFRKLNHVTKIDNLWDGYLEFKRAVENNAPEGYSLRDKDRYLWGRSFCDQLQCQVESGFADSSTEK